MRKVIYLLVFILCMTSAAALSCIEPGTPTEETGRYPYIFVGTVKSVGAPSGGNMYANYRTIQFTNAETIKGTHQDAPVVRTSASSATGGISPYVGQRWIVYAYSSAGAHYVSTCSRSSTNMADLTELRQWRGSNKQGIVVDTCVDPDKTANYRSVSMTRAITPNNYPDFYKKTSINVKTGNTARAIADNCARETLYEGFCADGVRHQVMVRCPNGCSDGACIDSSVQPTNSCSNGVRDGDETDVDCGGSCGKCSMSKRCKVSGDCQSGYACFHSQGAWTCKVKHDTYCKDSDESVNYGEVAMTRTITRSSNPDLFTKGIVEGQLADGRKRGGTDYCYTSTQLSEMFCDSQGSTTIRVNCPNGCEDGACVEEKVCPTAMPVCTEGSEIEKYVGDNGCTQYRCVAIQDEIVPIEGFDLRRSHVLQRCDYITPKRECRKLFGQYKPKESNEHDYHSVSIYFEEHPQKFTREEGNTQMQNLANLMRNQSKEVEVGEWSGYKFIRSIDKSKHVESSYLWWFSGNKVLAAYMLEGDNTFEYAEPVLEYYLRKYPSDFTPSTEPNPQDRHDLLLVYPDDDIGGVQAAQKLRYYVGNLGYKSHVRRFAQVNAQYSEIPIVAGYKDKVAIILPRKYTAEQKSLATRAVMAFIEEGVDARTYVATNLKSPKLIDLFESIENEFRPFCEDKDGGLNYKVASAATGCEGKRCKDATTYEDHCANAAGEAVERSSTLKEAFCRGQLVQWNQTNCNCVQGKCIKERKLPTWAADPGDGFVVRPIRKPGGDVTVHEVHVTGEHYVYNTLLVRKDSKWQRFPFTGTRVGKAWIKGNAKALLPTNTWSVGEYPAVAYACTRRENKWDCHGNKWMMNVITVEEALPQLPTLPGMGELERDADLAQCITDAGATLYGAHWSPHSKQIESSWGEAYDLLDYVECATEENAQVQKQVCIDAGVTAYPTWIFADGEKRVGMMSLEDLASRTECTN